MAVYAFRRMGFQPVTLVHQPEPRTRSDGLEAHPTKADDIGNQIRLLHRSRLLQPFDELVQVCRKWHLEEEFFATDRMNKPQLGGVER
jgi:hypothetical protein